MARYTCPDCRTQSDNVATEAEASQLLQTHQSYFCRPRRTTTTRPATPKGQSR